MNKNVISINMHRHRFPIGSVAMHRAIGWCEIIDISGTFRTIRWITHVPDAVPNIEDLPDDIAPHEVLCSETIITNVAEVDADDLLQVPTPTKFRVMPTLSNTRVLDGWTENENK